MNDAPATSPSSSLESQHSALLETATNANYLLLFHLGLLLGVVIGVGFMFALVSL